MARVEANFRDDVCFTVAALPRTYIRKTWGSAFSRNTADLRIEHQDWFRWVELKFETAHRDSTVASTWRPLKGLSAGQVAELRASAYTNRGQEYAKATLIASALRLPDENCEILLVLSAGSQLFQHAGEGESQIAYKYGALRSMSAGTCYIDACNKSLLLKYQRSVPSKKCLFPLPSFPFVQPWWMWNKAFSMQQESFALHYV